MGYGTNTCVKEILEGRRRRERQETLS
jgi:hypothetical protein